MDGSCSLPAETPVRAADELPPLELARSVLSPRHRHGSFARRAVLTGSPARLRCSHASDPPSLPQLEHLTQPGCGFATSRTAVMLKLPTTFTLPLRAVHL